MKQVQKVKGVDKVRLVRYLDYFVGAKEFEAEEVHEIIESAYTVMSRYRSGARRLRGEALFEAIHALLSSDQVRKVPRSNYVKSSVLPPRRGLFFARSIRI